MTKEQLKNLVFTKIDENKKRICEIGQKIQNHPEMGYREFNTSKIVKDELDRLNINYKDNIAITGVKGMVKGRKSLATVAIIGEMDAVTCPSHPKADKVSGAAHACGHNAQVASMLGAAIGLTAVNEMLDGDICFFAVPAEEYAEIEYRESLIKEGAISYFGGKQELIKLGEFDDVDVAMMVHAAGNTPEKSVLIGGSSLGFISKRIDFIGKAAHAGIAPHDGVNALNAAMAAMMCIHAQRETFKNEDSIRIHPIITNGGDVVNVVPSKVTMETYVRGASVKAIIDASEKVDRAIEGASYAIGAKCEIHTFKGYMPMVQSAKLNEIFKENTLFINDGFSTKDGDGLGGGSSDIGDLGHIIPVIQPCMGGFSGGLHSEEFNIEDEYSAYIAPAKIMAATVIDLLYDNADLVKEIKSNFKPLLSKEEYLNQ